MGVLGWVGWSFMTLLSLYFGFYGLNIYDAKFHQAATTQNLGESFFPLWFDAYHTESVGKYIAFVLHVMPGGIVFALSPFQFLGYIRKNASTVHRYSGYAILLSALVSVFGSFALLPTSKMGIKCAITTIFFGTYCIYCIYASYATAVAKDFVNHRKWSTRMWSLCFGVFWMRIMIGIIQQTLYPQDAWSHKDMAVELFSIEFFVGWSTVTIFTEIYLYFTSAPPKSKSQ